MPRPAQYSPEESRQRKTASSLRSLARKREEMGEHAWKAYRKARYESVDKLRGKKYREESRLAFLEKKYGAYDYSGLFGPCHICGQLQIGGLCVDHCHLTGTVRGLLCKKCNFGLGQFNDNKETLKKAIRYLSKKEKKTSSVKKRGSA